MIPTWFWYLNAFLFGSVVGSFLNVCIYRLPRGESIVFPPSHCPGCKKKIRPLDNIPLISYLILRGRCRYCKGKISFVYPLVEFLTASLFVIYTYYLGPRLSLIPYFILSSAMIVIFFIDLEHQIIPDAITLSGMIVGLAFFPLLPHSFMEGLFGLLGGGIFFYLVALITYLIIKKEGMGGGDIKMAAMMGAFLGWKVLIVAVFLALLSGSAVGILLMAIGKRGRKDAIPFGPFLALGTILATFWGMKIFEWYINLRL